MSEDASLSRLRLHHVGILVENIETYLKSSFWTRGSPIVEDPLQQARLCLAGLPGDERPLIELIEPLGEASPTYRALQERTNLHHLCFETGGRKEGDRLIAEYRFLPVTQWQPAVLFQGRPVRFAYTRNRELVEFLADE
jgi:hypothetical protein